MGTDEPPPEKPDATGDVAAGDVAAGEVTVYCAMCGTAGDGPPLTWMLEVDSRRGAVHYCDSCAREHLRAIEGRLQQEWW